MRRYGVGRLTGYPSVNGHRKPVTTWYVHDRCNMCLPVAEFNKQELADRRCFFLNAEERAWEKRGE